MVGEKVAITSDRPQTTRHTVRGIVHRPDAQLILVDTPGLHRPRTLLGQRLNDVVRETLDRGRRHRVLRAGGREGRSRRQVHRDGDRPARGRRRSPSSPRPTWPTARRSRSSCWPSPALADFAEVIPVSAVAGRAGRPPRRPAGGAAPGGAEALPRRRAHRRARAGHGRRADPRGRARRGSRRAPALAGRGRRGDDPSRGPPRGPAAASTSARSSTSSATARRPSSSAGAASALRQVGTRSRVQIEKLLGTPVYLDLQGQGRQGLAARPQAAPPARLLTPPLLHPRNASEAQRLPCASLEFRG